MVPASLPLLAAGSIFRPRGLLESLSSLFCNAFTWTLQIRTNGTKVPLVTSGCSLCLVRPSHWLSTCSTGGDTPQKHQRKDFSVKPSDYCWLSLPQVQCFCKTYLFSLVMSGFAKMVFMTAKCVVRHTVPQSEDCVAPHAYFFLLFFWRVAFCIFRTLFTSLQGFSPISSKLSTNLHPINEIAFWLTKRGETELCSDCTSCGKKDSCFVLSHKWTFIVLSISS